MASITPSIIFQNIAIVFVKCSLFFFCRNYLLDSLYQDLRALSTNDGGPLSINDTETAHHSDPEAEYELLPTSSRRPDARVSPISPKPGGLSSLAKSLLASKRPESDSALQSRLARVAFSLCFEESCTLFLLVMSQAVDVFDPQIRKFHWNISLIVLVCLVLAIIPLMQCLLFTYRSGISSIKKPWTRLLLSSIPFLLYLFAFSSVPLPLHLDNAGFFIKALSRMTVLGTLLLGLLSGFGAVSTTWSFRPYSGAMGVTERDINSASAALDRVRADLRARKNEAQRSGVYEASRSWLPTGLFKGSGSSAIIQEIDGLVALEAQMSSNLEALRERRTEIEFRRTITGKIWTVVGKIFAVYCVVRIISSMRNILFGSSGESGSSSPDIITYLLARFVSLFPSIPLTGHEVASLSRQISLLFVGCIILSSVRAVLRQVGRLVKSSSRTLGAAFLLLFLAQLMGTYLLSTLIQVRTSFPVEEKSPDVDQGQGEAPTPALKNNLFASLPEYQLFGTLFDASFLAAAALTAVFIWTHRQLNRAEIFT